MCPKNGAFAAATIVTYVSDRVRSQSGSGAALEKQISRVESGVTRDEECGLICLLLEDPGCAYYVLDSSSSKCYLGNPEVVPADSVVADGTIAGNHEMFFVSGMLDS